MKKYYFVLTSVLALTACGWGGGGGHSGSGVAAPRAAVSDAALASNGYITSMASEVLVPNGSGAIETRSGSVNFNGKTYTSYRLDDVNFRVATGANDAFLRFNMDENGKIDSLVMNVGTPEAMSDQHMVRRSDDSADFRGIVYEYTVLDDTATEHDDYSKNNRETLVRLVLSPEEDAGSSYSMLSSAAAGKCPENKYCRWDRIDQAFRVTSSGSEDGLKYSDFGKLQTVNFGKYKGVTEGNFAEAKTNTRGGNGSLGDYDTWDDITDSDFEEEGFEVFAGGYRVSALQHRPTTNMQFTGKAIGSLYASDSAHHPDVGVKLEDDNATLVFDTATGKETLTMDFTGNEVPWYKVTVTKDNNNGTNKIEFDEYANVTSDHVMYETRNEFGDPIDADTGTSVADYLKFHGDAGDGLVVNDFTTSHGALVKDVEGTATQGLLDMAYYGVTGPEEATGMVRFKETYQTEDNVQYEHEFRAGYGMKPDAE